MNTSYKQVAEPTDIYHVPVVAFVAESTWSECLVSSSFFLWRRIEQENTSVLFSYIMQPKGNLSLSLLLFCEFYGFLFCRPSCFLGPVFTQHLPYNLICNLQPATCKLGPPVFSLSTHNLLCSRELLVLLAPVVFKHKTFIL